MELRDRIRGSLLAGAAGDALGAPVEFMSGTEIGARFGQKGVRDFAPAYGRRGAITDDTQMTLFTAEGLIRALLRGAERGIVHPPSVVHHAYLRWLATQGGTSPLLGSGPDGWLVGEPRLHARRAPGNTCLSALTAARRFGEPARNNSKGCGTVMRSAPFGFLRMPSAEIFELTAECAQLTHGHPTAHVAAGALALIVHFITEGASRHEAVERASAFLEELPDPNGETLAALEAARRLASAPDWRARIPELGAGWVAEEALAIAVACALGARDLEDALTAAVSHGGDSDSTGAICGNILGAELGPDALPARWRAEVELADVILRVADDLALAIETGGDVEAIRRRGGADLLDRYPPN